MALALLVPMAVACGEPSPAPIESPRLDAGTPGEGTDASVPTPPAPRPDVPEDGGGTPPVTPEPTPPDAGTQEPEPPRPLALDLSAPVELLVRGGGSAVLRVGLQWKETVAGPVTLSLRGLPSELFSVERVVPEGTSAGALVVSASERVGPGTRIDALLVASSQGRSTSRPLRLLISGAPFSLDPTFPVLPFGWTGWDRLVTVQPDGKILAARAIPTDTTGKGFLLERYHPDGTTDLTFGTLGVATHLKNDVRGVLALVALPSGGSLVASVGCEEARGCSYGVSRHLPSGALDSSFGNAGHASTRFDDARAREGMRLLVDAEGRVVLVGSFYAPSRTPAYFYGVQRWSAGGQPLADFGTGGNLLVPLPTDGHFTDSFEAALVRATGELTLAVHLADPDAPNKNGLAFFQVPMTGSAVSVMKNSMRTRPRSVAAGQGRFVVLYDLGEPSYAVAVSRYTDTGGYLFPQEDFTPPVRLLAIGSANQVFLDQEGTPYALGQAEGGGGLAVIRFSPKNRADPTFGEGGLLRLDGRLRQAVGFMREPSGALLARTGEAGELIRFWP
ncbi:hypothetical protein [Melittangium boletus]|uniref:hypothetical protein n=1 Tax=Melittangium boletus TaxID=83453 RepID=UPI003DA3608E